MTDTVDPSRVPTPLAPSELLARDQTIQTLQEAFAQGAMTVEQLDERLELAEQARTQAELAVLTQDLPSAPKAAPLATPAPAEALPALQGEPLTLLGLFSSASRTGQWTPTPMVKSVALFGEVKLDFSEAALRPGQVTHVQCVATLGGVEITVPSTVNVTTKGVGLLGQFKGHDIVVDKAAPTLHISGAAVLGSVKIKILSQPGPASPTLPAP